MFANRISTVPGKKCWKPGGSYYFHHATLIKILGATVVSEPTFWHRLVTRNEHKCHSPLHKRARRPLTNQTALGPIYRWMTVRVSLVKIHCNVLLRCCMCVMWFFESEADVDLLPDGEQGGEAFTFELYLIGWLHRMHALSIGRKPYSISVSWGESYAAMHKRSSASWCRTLHKLLLIFSVMTLYCLMCHRSRSRN